MEVKVFDNLFTDKFLMDTYIACKSIPWSYSCSGNRKAHPHYCPLSIGNYLFFGAMLYEKTSYFNIKNTCPDILFEVLEHFVLNELNDKSLKLFTIVSNLQVKGQNGESHRDFYVGDGRDRTIMFYPHYKWEDSWGGEFQILDDDDNVIESILPLPGRIIYFDSSVNHRALAPNIPNVARMSIAYRMEKF